ncbi:MAG: hypothetical protein ACREL7_03120 [Longimicrobiales bacterium]
MKRAIFAAAAALITLPAASSAQAVASTMDVPVWGPRIRITPFVGHAASVSRTERWTFDIGGQLSTARYDVDIAPGWAGGASIEIQVADALAFIGEGLYVTRGRTLEESPDVGDRFEHEGSNFVLAKGALALRLRERTSELQMRTLTATVFAGPAWIHEMPKDDATSDPILLESQNYWAVNFGVNAQLPIGWEGVLLQGGVEDFLVWWNNDELAARNDALLGPGATSVVETDPSHMWIFRVGLAFAMQ